MPRAKRPLAESDPNVQGSTEQAAENGKPKRQRVSAKSQFEQSSFTGNYEYVCISKPPYASDRDDDGDDDEDEDRDGDEESDSIWGKPASEHPEWKWIMLKESLDMLGAAYQATDHRDPDSFDMYVYNDFLGYGIIEIIENMVQAFNKELKPQKGKKYNYQQMWAVVATLAHYLNRDLSMPWMMVDDGDRCARLNALIGCMVLTMLNELDRTGQLTSDSKFLDLGHVMALYLLWSTSANETTIEFSELSDVDDAGEEPEDVDWQEALVAYAEKINIDLAEQGVSGIQDALDDINAEPLDGKAKAERWKWTPLLREYRVMHGYRKTILAGSAPLIGGEEFNIMKMSRQERADYAFDKVDPLAQFTDEEIASGKLTLQ